MNNDDIQPLTVTVEQAAKLLGIGRSTAYELVHTGDIPSLRLGRRIVVPTARLAVLLATAPSDIADTEVISHTREDELAMERPHPTSESSALV